MTSLNVRILPISTRDQYRAWNDLASKSSVGHMHQSLWWAEPLGQFGVRSQALGCWKDHHLVGGALFRSIPVPFTGTSLTECLDGPIFLEWDSTWAGAFVSALVELSRAVSSMAVVIKRCPSKEVHEDIVGAFGRAGLSTTLSPEVSEAILFLEGRTIDVIRKGFNDRTKRSIKKGQRDPIYVRRLVTSEDLRKAYDAWMATAVRKGFSDVRPWPALEPVLCHCVDNGLGSVLASFHGERILAAVFVAYVGKTATYVYGGYMDGCEQYHPNHVLHYEAIRECLEKGMNAYSFGSLISDGQPQRSGVDEFKLGFGALPRQHLDTITWQRKPLLCHCIEHLRGGLIGRKLRELLKRHLVRRGHKDNQSISHL